MSERKFIPDDRRAYLRIGHLNEGRFVDYWHTYKLACESGGQSVVEIGIGNGIVAWLLKESGLSCHTVDIEPALKPDTVADVRELPFDDGQFDTAICCEVLEHLPFDQFVPALTELQRVTKHYAVISLPHLIPAWYVIANLPLVGGVWASMQKPFVKRVEMTDHHEHFWSLGAKGCSDREVDAAIKASGWDIKKSYRPGFNKDHKFYLLTQR